MPRYAYFDHAAPAPQKVLGWYDTDENTYARLPSEEDLVPVSEGSWDARLADPNAWAVSNGAIVAYTPPASADSELASRISAGIAVTSASTPTLDSTYALDAVTLTQIGSVARDAASGLGLPGGGATFTYPDASGSPKTFTTDQIIALYKAMRDLLLGLNTQAAIMHQGGTPAWPAQTATIA